MVCFAPFPPIGVGVGAPQGCENDATHEPEDAYKRLQALILSIFINQNDIQSEPLKPTPSDQRAGGAG